MLLESRETLKLSDRNKYPYPDDRGIFAMKVKELITPSTIDKKAIKMQYPNVYKNKDIGAITDIRREKVVIKDKKTGKIYTYRTIHTKPTS